MKIVLALLVITGIPLAALETSTHVLVARRAVASWTFVENGTERNRLDQVIQKVLGYQEGRETVLNGRTVEEWIDLGGELEDQGSVLKRVGRFYRHFHDPLQPWDSAGLTAFGQNESSIRWMQNERQTLTGAAGGNWSWRDARRMYYQALIEPDPERRDALMAATFRTLGQIMHLVVDASNPDHSRNDPHPLPSVPLVGALFWNYDKHVESRHGRPDGADEQAFVARFLSNPIGFDRAIFQIPSPPGEQVATVPVSRLIDADVYDGGNPNATFNAADPSAPVAAGIAEISNANFFSENTLNGPYANPPSGTNGLIRTELELSRRTPDGRHLVRRYWTRPAGQGFLPANPLRAECAGSRNPRAATAPYPCVDDVVWDQVAAHMLPRAVGYARGVLEYFFRGALKVHRVYTQSGNTFIQIENLTNEDMEGTIELHARATAGTASERRQRSGWVNGGAVTALPAKAMITVPVTLLPVETASASQILVFRGRSGAEDEAAAAQVFNVHHVLIRQTGNTGVMRSSCSSTNSPNRTSIFCNWLPRNQQLAGELVTGSTDPVVASISAVWVLGGGTLPLEVDGVPVAGVWRRQGSEPDPISFVIRPGGNVGQLLRLTVQLLDGTVISRDMAHFINAATRTEKYYTPTVGGTVRPPFFIASERQLIQFRITAEAPFRTVSINGYDNPTSVVEDRYGDSRLLEHTTVTDRPFFLDALHSQRWIDFVRMFEDKPLRRVELAKEMEQALKSVSLPPLPVPLWTAVVEQGYDPAELDFLSTFVRKDLQPTTFTITAVGPPGT